MGLELGQEQIRLEKRLGNIFIRRDLHTNSLSASIEGVIGFYDQSGVWHNVRSETVEISGDAALVVLGVTMDRAGNPRNLGEFISNVAYAILAGQIPTSAVLTVKATADGSPVPAYVTVSKDGILYASGPAGQPIHAPVLLNAMVTVSANGYRPVDMQVPLLGGQVDLNVELEPIEE